MMLRLATFLALLVFIGCATMPPPDLADWLAWQSRRNESVGGTNGWTTLIGLHWLSEGPNTTGAGPGNQIVLRSRLAPASLGVFTRKGAGVFFQATPGVDVLVEGRKVERIEMVPDTADKPTKLQIGPISVVVLERGERMGLRVKDSDAESRRQFKGLRRFPYDPAWRLDGHFSPFAQPRKMRVKDVTEATQEFDCPGAVVFKVKGKEYRLEVALEPREPDFFILFRDSTAGETTYPSGRFLYVSKPDAAGRVIIDFNRAYTPPCGFTEYATCPVPPRQNWLPFPVQAGEMNPHGSHHP